MNIKRSVNKFQIVGSIDEINLKVDDSLVSKKNPKIKGAIVKADFKNPSVTIDVGGQTIGVDFYPTYKQREKDGKIEDNPRYKALETIMNYENANSSPMAYAVLRLAVYYGCTMEELLTKNLRKERKNIT